jgi:hypothetical protein
VLPDGFDTIFSAANFTSINNFGGAGGRLREPCVLVVSFCLTRNTGFQGLGEGEGGDAEWFCFACGVTDKQGIISWFMYKQSPFSMRARFKLIKHTFKPPVL